MRLINVDTLIDEIRKDAEITIELDDKVGSFWLGYVAGLVIKQPTIQYEPHEGHWIGGDGSYICSECNSNPIDFIETMGSSFDVYVETPMNYCPNCGAKMRRKIC